MIRLYLVQHAHAVSKEQNPARPLSSKGISELNAVIEFLKPLKIAARRILHSDKTRAIQTANELAEVIQVDKGCAPHPGLGPNDDVRKLEDEINNTKDDLMIVGHLPFLSKLASELLSGSQLADTICFRQGGVLCLNYNKDTGWQVEWMVIPDLLR